MSRIRKGTVISIVIASVILILGILILINMNGKVFTKGRCVVAASGSVLWIDDSGSPIVLSNRTEDKNIFEGLSTGDEILILRQTAIAESYPGQVGIYYCKKLSDGSESDIPVQTLESLRELGWIK